MAQNHSELTEKLKSQVQPLELTDTMADAARKAMLTDLIQMLEHEEGSRSGGDIEDVHDMRVATRRMRSIFLLLAEYFKPRLVESYQQSLRRVARALGRVRDLDVMIDEMQKFQQTLPLEQRDHLQPVLEQLDHQRKAARKKLNARLNEAAYENFVNDFSQFLSTPGVGAREAANNSASTQIRYVIPVIVHEHLATVRAYDSQIESADGAALHQLRIEFKQLRYLVSMYTDVLGTGARDFIKLIKEIQDHLGEMNDAQVAGARLAEMFPDLTGEQAAVLKLYTDGLAEKAARLRAEFDDLWHKFNTKTVQKQIAGAMAGL